VSIVAAIMLANAGYVASDFDLAKLKPTRGACRGDADVAEIVVCARRRGQDQRVSRGDPPVEPLLPKAELSLPGDVGASVSGEQGSIGNIPTNRAMVKVRIPF